MIRRRLQEVRILADGRGVFVRTGGPADGARLPVVCVHGAIVSGQYMLPTAERLATRRRVIVPDLPGFGHSDHPPEPLAVPALADALRTVLDVLGVERAHILGNSLGAQVTAEFAMRFPERTASAILVGPTVDGRAPSLPRQAWRLALDAFRERPPLLAIVFADIFRDGLRFAATSLLNALRDRIEDKVPHISAPVLIVSGTRDPLAPPEWATELGSLTPCARVELIPGPHALNYSRPDELVRAVAEFIEGLEAAGDGSACERS